MQRNHIMHLVSWERSEKRGPARRDEETYKDTKRDYLISLIPGNNQDVRSEFHSPGPFPFAGQTYGPSPTRLANFFPFSASPGTLSRRITRKLRPKYIIPYLDYGIALSSEGIGKRNKRKIYDGPRFAGDAEGKVLSAVSEISITDPSNSSYSKRGDIRGTESPRSALVPIPPVNAIRNVPECIPFQFGMRRSRGDARRST